MAFHLLSWRLFIIPSCYTCTFIMGDYDKRRSCSLFQDDCQMYLRQNKTEKKSLLALTYSPSFNDTCSALRGCGLMPLPVLLKFGNFSSQQCALFALFRRFIVCISAVMVQLCSLVHRYYF